MRATPAATRDTDGPALSRLPDLRIIPSGSLLLHEESDPYRVQRLAKRLTDDGVLRNPPIAAVLDGGDHVVLDGANRVTALRQIGCREQVVQIVDYDSPAVRLDVWAHLLFEHATPATDRWEATAIEAVGDGLKNGALACALVTDAGAWGLAMPDGIEARVATLSKIVSEYRSRGGIHRVPPGDVPALRKQYLGVTGLVLFAPLAKHDVEATARLPIKLPSGITRHVIENRALRLNLDLAILRDPAPLEVKQARLRETIRARLHAHRVRHYVESTVLFDD